MIISKGSVISKVLAELTVASKTPNVSTLVQSFVFKKNTGYFIKCVNNIKSIYVKDSSVDFDAKINSEIFISLINSKLAKKDSVNISIDGNKLKIDDVTLCTDIESNCSEEFPTLVKNDVSFTKEQFAKLEKDFKFTLGNFQNPKNIDTIGFAIKEGTLFKILPGCNIYSISKFDCLSDDVTLSQKFGHATAIFLFPHKIFDLMKDENNIRIDIKDRMEIAGENIYIRYDPTNYGISAFANFEDRILNNSELEFSIKDIKPITSVLEGIINNSFEESEDLIIEVDCSNKVIKSIIDSTSFEVPTEFEGNFKFSVNSVALLYILKNLPENTKFRISDNFFVIINGNNSFFINNNNVD